MYFLIHLFLALEVSAAICADEIRWMMASSHLLLK